MPENARYVNQAEVERLRESLRQANLIISDLLALLADGDVPPSLDARIIEQRGGSSPL